VSRNLGKRDSPLKRISANQQGVRNEEQKPVLGGPKVFVGDYIGPGDPGNDPPYTSDSSPPWQNGFTYVAGSPIWFAHGVDGETDMGGAYDLVTGSPVSGNIAFTMPLEWANETPELVLFPALATNEADPADDVIIVCCQRVMASGDVRIYWPTFAQLYVP
jgi:hypothetical protein